MLTGELDHAVGAACTSGPGGTPAGRGAAAQGDDVGAAIGHGSPEGHGLQHGSIHEAPASVVHGGASHCWHGGPRLQGRAQVLYILEVLQHDGLQGVQTAGHHLHAWSVAGSGQLQGTGAVTQLLLFEKAKKQCMLMLLIMTADYEVARCSDNRSSPAHKTVLLEWASKVQAQAYSCAARALVLMKGRAASHACRACRHGPPAKREGWGQGLP